jgi:putative glutamine amidotransferase
MNVSLGGTLIPDVRGCGLTALNHQQEEPYQLCHQTVHIQPETQLFDLLFGAERRQIRDIDWVLDTNSMHHQAIEHPAHGLYINAISTDGVYEGVEDPSKRFYIGVQWHPEYLENCLPLFAGLRDACLHP